jgi:hypothetical protein
MILLLGTCHIGWWLLNHLDAWDSERTIVVELIFQGMWGLDRTPVRHDPDDRPRAGDFQEL